MFSVTVAREVSQCVLFRLAPILDIPWVGTDSRKPIFRRAPLPARLGQKATFDPVIENHIRPSAGFTLTAAYPVVWAWC